MTPFIPSFGPTNYFLWLHCGQIILNLAYILLKFIAPTGFLDRIVCLCIFGHGTFTIEVFQSSMNKIKIIFLNFRFIIRRFCTYIVQR